MTKFYGGVGYLLKDRVSDLATFASDVRRVASGDCVIDPSWSPGWWTRSGTVTRSAP